MRYQTHILGLVLILLMAGAAVAMADVADLGYPPFAQATGPADFIQKLYDYALSIAGTLAVVMIVYGGVKYVVSAGSVSAQSDARDIIKNAVWGIVLLGGAYLVLNTINPRLVNLSENEPGIAPITAAPTSTPTSPYQGSVSNLTQKEAEYVLNYFGISWRSSGNCSDPNNSNCTSFEGLLKRAVCRLIEMRYNGADDLTITAGTEVGHQTHGPGIPVVDLSTTVHLISRTDLYILKQIGIAADQVELNTKHYTGLGDFNSYTLEESSSVPKHWHVRLNERTDVDISDAFAYSGSGEVVGLSSEWFKCKTPD